MDEKILIGCHVSMNAPDFFLGSVQEALSYNATTFMFYTGAPQNSYRKPLEQLKIAEGKKLLSEAGIDPTNLVVHAPYIINGANKVKPELFDLSVELILRELERTEAFGVKTLVLHPGAHVGQGKDVAISALAECLDKVFESNHSDVKIALETMSGKGTEIGTNFNEIRQIIDSCHHQDRLGVCLDTCHINDSGYDVHDVDAVLKQFDEIIGLNRLLVVHVNDSKNPKESHKDRHENVGYGYVGFKTMYEYIHHPLLRNIPKILETPYIEQKPPYKQEIQMLVSGQYIEGWKENF